MSTQLASQGRATSFAEIIAIKRDGGELSREQVARFVRGACDGTVGDEQLAALLMALCIRGASPAETWALVEEMRDSGALWNLKEKFPNLLDKHSTGGVGDTVSLIFAPLVAACGVPVAMMAGAGLGHTQGTLDKLAAIPGFVAAGSRAEAVARLERCGVCFAAQSREVAPADRKLYALRDLTATVPSLPLIVASIMAKKLAVGAAALVLDVKVGRGAFSKTMPQAQALANALLEVARAAGLPAKALLSDMNEPLGRRLGCAAEVREAIAVLDGQGSPRLRELTLELAVEGMGLVGRPLEEARRDAVEALESGKARRMWDQVLEAHGGDVDLGRLPQPLGRVEVVARESGYVAAVDGESLGWIAVALGAGRRFQGDTVDYAAGLVVHVGIGERVTRGQPLVTLELGQRGADVEALAVRAAGAFAVQEEPVAASPLVAGVLRGE